MSYITPLSASIIAETGATCDLTAPDDVYQTCKQTVRRQLLTSVALTSLLSTLLMGLWANLPFILAPGIGTSAYFTYSVVGVRGSGFVRYKTATTAVVLEGIVFLFLSLSGLRAWAVKSLPSSIKLAMSGGIGLFLAFIGLQASEGIGLISLSRDTLVTLGGCPADHRLYPIEGGVAYECVGGRMHSATTWLGLLALLLMTALLEKGVRTAVGLVMLLVSLLSWIRDTPFTFFPRDGPEGVGEARFHEFQKIVSVEGLGHVAGQCEFDRLGDPHVWVALLTLLYTDVLDTTGCLHSMARQAGMLREDGGFEGERAAFCVDAIGAMVAGLLGLSPVVVFMESAVGIEVGARTGLAAVVGSLGFLLSIVLTPVLASVPPFATGAALVLVGCILMEHLSHIDWTNKRVAMPAFLTAILMPLTYSIAYGVIAGIFSSVVLRGLFWVLDAWTTRKRWCGGGGRGSEGGRQQEEKIVKGRDGGEKNGDDGAGGGVEVEYHGHAHQGNAVLMIGETPPPSALE
jgi:AGZA family xanthine/uracil permease-like MFS transporter